MLKYILLGELNYLPLTGYQLKQFFDNAGRHFWHAQVSQIYRTLAAMEAEGLVTSEVQAQEARPDRRLYTITDAGRADLLAWLKTPLTEIEPTKDSLMVKLFFSAAVDKETVLAQLRIQRALHEEQLRLYRGEIKRMIEGSAAEHPALKRDALMWDITRRNGELMEEAYIRWLDEAIERIEAHN